MSFAIVFPGQGSQSVGMLSELAVAHPIVRATFQEASEATGVDLWVLSQEGPAETLNLTENTQPALLAAGVAVWRVYGEQGGERPTFLAGHSLGEYSALVAAGVLDFKAAARLVQKRGQLMQAAVPVGEGGMAAIIGLDNDKVQALCDEHAAGQVLSPANFNAHGQVVIAGDAAAVERAVANAKAFGAKLAKALPVSVPSHCMLMRDAADALTEELNAVEMLHAEIPVIQNVQAKPETDPDAIRASLAKQLYSPVRWVETVEFMASQGVEKLTEFGPGKVLVGLNKRIDKSMTASSFAF